jgi:ATP-binding protein involved in chromosome partitioning
MKSLTKENILDVLRQVKDPDLHRDIVDLDFVKEISINGSDVAVTVELTTPACPVRDELKDSCDRVIRENIDKVGNIAITMTSNVVRRADARQEAILPGVKHKIAIASGKGGVGKSTIAVNLAVALAHDGAKVGLVDADVYGPSIPLMMGIDDKPRLRKNKIVPLENYGVKVMSMGFLVDPLQAIIWRGPMASGAVKQFLTDVEWGDLDYLLFDLPPGTGDIQLTLVQTIPLTGSVIITTPQDISLADARKGLMMFRKVNVPVLGIIENMSYYICSHCGHREEIFSYGGGRRTAEELETVFLGEIPIQTSIRIGSDSGKPIVVSENNRDLAAIIQNIARAMAAQLSIHTINAPAVPLMSGLTTGVK